MAIYAIRRSTRRVRSHDWHWGSSTEAQLMQPPHNLRWQSGTFDSGTIANAAANELAPHRVLIVCLQDAALALGKLSPVEEGSWSSQGGVLLDTFHIPLKLRLYSKPSALSYMRLLLIEGVTWPLASGACRQRQVICYRSYQHPA